MEVDPSGAVDSVGNRVLVVDSNLASEEVHVDREEEDLLGPVGVDREVASIRVGVVQVLVQGVVLTFQVEVGGHQDPGVEGEVEVLQDRVVVDHWVACQVVLESNL